VATVNASGCSTQAGCQSTDDLAGEFLSHVVVESRERRRKREDGYAAADSDENKVGGDIEHAGARRADRDARRSPGRTDGE
jgi:hypothetical protein